MGKASWTPWRLIRCLESRHSLLSSGRFDYCSICRSTSRIASHSSKERVVTWQMVDETPIAPKGAAVAVRSGSRYKVVLLEQPLGKQINALLRASHDDQFVVLGCLPEPISHELFSHPFVQAPPELQCVNEDNWRARVEELPAHFDELMPDFEDRANAAPWCHHQRASARKQQMLPGRTSFRRSSFRSSTGSGTARLAAL